jgi:hypothetical protein
MSMPPLNLASRPFRNERLPALLLALGFTAAGAITIKHVMAVRALMPGRTSALARQVKELEDERERLREGSSHLRAPRPEPAAVAQWGLLKELVDRRTFSWSGLFAVLEETLPKGVRLVSISPRIDRGERRLDLAAVARTNEDVLELIRVLEDRPEFDDVLPRNRAGEQSELTFRLTMKYTPPPEPPVRAASAPAPAPSPAAAAASPGVEGPPAAPRGMD